MAAIGAATGIIGAIAIAKEVIGGITDLFDGATSGLVEVIANRMPAEEYVEKMREVRERVKGAKDVFGPLVKESREKDANLDKGWDQRLTDPE